MGVKIFQSIGIKNNMSKYKPYDRDLINVKDIQVLLDHLASNLKEPNNYKYITPIINARIAEKIETSIVDLNKSINEQSESNKSLATKVFWLNIILTTATVILAAVSITKLFYCNS